MQTSYSIEISWTVLFISLLGSWGPWVPTRICYRHRDGFQSFPSSPTTTQLSRNYTKALERVSAELEFFPKHLQHRSKQRLTKIHQYLIRMRKLKLKAKPKLVTINPKVRKWGLLFSWLLRSIVQRLRFCDEIAPVFVMT